MKEVKENVAAENVAPYPADEEGVQKGDVVKVVPEPDRAKTGGITGSTLKIIAIITMFIDHVGAALFEHYLYKFLEPLGADYCEAAVKAKLPWLWFNWMGDPAAVQNIDMTLRMIGRIAFPIFCFLLVEGFLHTRNLKKYMIRLGIFALVSDVPFDLAFFGEIGLNHQNVFFTLFLGVCAMYFIDKVKNMQEFNGFFKFLGKIGFLIAGGLGAWAACTSMCTLIGYVVEMVSGIENIWIITTAVLGFLGGIIPYLIVTAKWDGEKKTRLASLLFVIFVFFGLAEILHTDYSGWGVTAIIAIYLFRNAKSNGFVWGMIALTIKSIGEGVAFIDLIPLKFYNGKRGRQMKYFFYAFYPVHLFLLFLVRYFIFGV